MSIYRVFLGAPSTADIRNDPGSYSWRTVSSSSSHPGSRSLLATKSTRLNVLEDDSLRDTDPASASVSVIFPFALATLEAASIRISSLYKDVIFREAELDSYEEPEEGQSEKGLQLGSEPQEPRSSTENEMREVEVSVFRGVGEQFTENLSQRSLSCVL